MRIVISNELLAKHPNLTKNEIRAIVRVFINYKTYKLKGSRMVNFVWPMIGKIKSHGNKKAKKYLALDRKKKRKLRDKQLLTRKRLLF